MPDWTDVLSGLDAPRPLPPSLRERLESQLLGDPLLAALDGVDGPRPLPPGVRAALAGRLGRATASPVWRRPHVALAAAAAAVAGLLVGGALVAPGHHAGTTVADPSPSPAPFVPPPGPAGSAAGGVEPPVPALGPGRGPASAPSAAPRPSAAPSAWGPAAGGAGGMQPAAGAQGAGPGTYLGSVSPGEGPLRGGTRLVLSGKGLTRVVRVEVGGRPASDLRVESDSTVTALTPGRSSPGAVEVVVVLSDGARYGLSPGFVYVALPVVEGLDPTSGPMAGGTWVRVSGRAFTQDCQVVFGTTPAARVVVQSDASLLVLTPQHLPGYVDVRVTTGGGTSATSSATRFLFTP